MNMRKAVTIAGVATGILFGTAGVAGAAEPGTVDLSVHAGAAVLKADPAGGYTGSALLRLTYHGPAGLATLVRVQPPDGLSFETTDNDELVYCIRPNHEHTQECAVNRPLVDGETREIRINYRALAAPTAKTRYTATASISARSLSAGQEVPDRTPADNTSTYRGVLRGTGHGTDPREYHPATKADMTATRTGPVASSPDGDTWRTSVTLTVKAKTDAYHAGLNINLLDPLPGFVAMSVPGSFCVDTWCQFPGWALPQGLCRQATVTVVTTTALPPGPTFRLMVDSYDGFGHLVPEANPADNVVTVTI